MSTPEAPAKCPHCGKKVPKADPEVMRELLTRHLRNSCTAAKMVVPTEQDPS